MNDDVDIDVFSVHIVHICCSIQLLLFNHLLYIYLSNYIDYCKNCNCNIYKFIIIYVHNDQYIYI